MATNRFKSALNKLRNLNPVTRLREEIEEIINDECEQYIKQRLEDITAPFNTEFTFEVVKTNFGDKIQFQTRPVFEEIERTTGTGGTVNSWVLFNTLDLGSEGAKLVLLPDDFSNESFPNSLQTRSSGYNRKYIVAVPSKSGKDMEPRNWSIILAEEFEATRPNNIKNNIGRLVGKYFGE